MKLINVPAGVYPYSLEKLRADNPGTSFPLVMPSDRLAEFGVFSVTETPQPPFNPSTHKLVELLPVNQAGQWVQVWDLVPLTDDELAQAAKLLQQQIIDATQQRLDDFARTRNYDGILSACTYATSTVAKFAAEGQYAVNARDITWATLYQVLDEVQNGVRQPPQSFADVEPLLPTLAWPA